VTVEITVVVKSTNHNGDVTLTKRFTDSGGNPRFDGDIVRRNVATLGDELAHQLDQLVKSPIRTTP
jgi:hypothetical protein